MRSEVGCGGKPRWRKDGYDTLPEIGNTGKTPPYVPMHGEDICGRFKIYYRGGFGD